LISIHLEKKKRNERGNAGKVACASEEGGELKPVFIDGVYLGNNNWDEIKERANGY